MPYYYTPPYFLIVAGLLAGLASGIAFDATLKQAVQDWSQNRSTRTLAVLRGPQLLVPFIGIAGGICVFLSAGLGLFGFSAKVACAISLPFTALTCGLVWWQLGKILVQLERGGSQAIDLDSFG